MYTSDSGHEQSTRAGRLPTLRCPGKDTVLRDPRRVLSVRHNLKTIESLRNRGYKRVVPGPFRLLRQLR